VFLFDILYRVGNVHSTSKMLYLIVEENIIINNKAILFSLGAILYFIGSEISS